MRLILVITALILTSFPTFTNAQFDLGAYTTNPAYIAVSPISPEPGEEITVTLQNTNSLTAGAGITWRVNGEVMSDAQNRRETSFIAADLGDVMRIEAILRTSTGQEQVVSTTVEPAYIDIIIEPQTHVPNFYQGRALPSVGSEILATALVQTDTLETTDLIYTWQINQTVIEGGPIRNRNNVVFTMPRGRDAVLSLTVSRPNGAVIGRKLISVPSVSPTLYFYESNALYGTREIGIQRELLLTANTATIVAEPYHLDSRVFNNPAIHEWSIDGVKNSNTASNPYQVTVQRTGETGRSAISFTVRDTNQPLQYASASTRIVY